MTFPPACITIGIVFFGCHSAFFLLQKQQVEFLSKSSILVSSDHTTFSQSSSGSFKCSLANFRRVWTCTGRGTHLALQDLSPWWRGVTAIVNQWKSVQHSSEQPTDAFGEVQFAGASKRHSYFLRLSWSTEPSVVYNILTTHWHLPLPNLVVSVVGGNISSPGRISGKWKEADSEPAMMSIQQTKTSVRKRRSYVCSLPNSGNSEASPLSQGLYTWRLELPQENVW
uniref:Uncharacterized protein n=1 Tax=Pundamilia nyererei TaxID=303518 RepID=A0A3B4G8E9_9CICH